MVRKTNVANIKPDHLGNFDYCSAALLVKACLFRIYARISGIITQGIRCIKKGYLLFSAYIKSYIAYEILI